MPNLITEPKSDDMTGFDPEIEKIVDEQAGFADGSIGFIQKRVPLSGTELLEKRNAKTKEAIAPLESKLVDGTISEFELAKLNSLYKLIS